MRKTLQQTLAFALTVKCFLEIYLSSVGNIRGSVIGIENFFFFEVDEVLSYKKIQTHLTKKSG